ncbi:DUF2157 domain-containing protein [Acidovorax sp. A1169]|uniref:DUF2157 domain-containing protein n=1 Tax=Acidovorax sp. A1169 TaxID=3059524 RepID=UPI002737BEB7|nr:DUF2157 domain-containing protein [Acidovorax sp. A1169]MDP4077299.1 DUF2157 domain-containing protein [Acidovorax sp. A1169]
MTLRTALFELARQHTLDRPAATRLLGLAGFDRPPAALHTTLWRTVAVIAAALGGLGLVMWIAANWESLGRFMRFALLQGFVLTMCAGAALRAGARAPLAMLALLGTGALFAYFGQTYQTGADPWQLFAVWAVLTLPLALAVRSDVVWVPWTLVAMVGISLWAQAHTGHSWRVSPADMTVHLVSLGAALAVAAAMLPQLHRVTGAGVWALRTAGTLALMMVTLTALGGLFHSPVAGHYGLGLVLLAAAAALVGMRTHFDIFLLSGAALGLNILLVTGLARAMFSGSRFGDFVGSLLLIGLVAAGLLAATVNLVMRLARRAAQQQGEAA